MDTFNMVVVVVAFLVSLFNLWDKVDARIKEAKAPTKLLSSRIDEMEKEMKQKFTAYDQHFDKDLTRIDRIEEGNKITQQALLALLNHAIDGNDIEEVRNASKDLTKYLIRR